MNINFNRIYQQNSVQRSFSLNVGGLTLNGSNERSFTEDGYRKTNRVDMLLDNQNLAEGWLGFTAATDRSVRQTAPSTYVASLSKTFGFGLG